MVRFLAAAALAVTVAAPGAGGPALIDAVKAGDGDAVRQLLREKIDVDAQAADGSTALYFAAQRNDADLVKLLVGAGADVNAATRYGATALTLACVPVGRAAARGQRRDH